MHVREFARQHAVPYSTIAEALAVGTLNHDPAGGIDPLEAEAWLEGYRARAERIRSSGHVRQQALDAQALTAAEEARKLRRQIDTLRAETVSRDMIEAAVQRRSQRLQAAIAAIPGLLTAEVAVELQREPSAVHAVLARFVAVLVGDLGDLQGPEPIRLGGGRCALGRHEGIS